MKTVQAFWTKHSSFVTSDSKFEQKDIKWVMAKTSWKLLRQACQAGLKMLCCDQWNRHVLGVMAPLEPQLFLAQITPFCAYLFSYTIKGLEWVLQWGPLWPLRLKSKMIFTWVLTCLGGMVAHILPPSGHISGFAPLPSFSGMLNLENWGFIPGSRCQQLQQRREGQVLPA